MSELTDALGSINQKGLSIKLVKATSDVGLYVTALDGLKKGIQQLRDADAGDVDRIKNILNECKLYLKTSQSQMHREFGRHTFEGEANKNLEGNVKYAQAVLKIAEKILADVGEALAHTNDLTPRQ